MRAHDFLKVGEKAIALFTYGPHLSFFEDARGTSGKWDVNPKRVEGLGRVIVYLRDEHDVNHVYLATSDGTRSQDASEGYYIDLKHIQYAGRTKLNWHEFAGEGQKPFRYVTGGE